jgi:hypothetical protein
MNHLEMARAWHVQTNDGALSAREGDSGESTEGFFFLATSPSLLTIENALQPRLA